MDWLSFFRATIDCFCGRVSVCPPVGDYFHFVGDRSDFHPTMIFSIGDWSHHRSYLASLLGDEGNSLGRVFSTVVDEFLDVFPEELTELPPLREVVFAIDVIPGTAPISMALHRKANVVADTLSRRPSGSLCAVFATKRNALKTIDELFDAFMACMVVTPSIIHKVGDQVLLKVSPIKGVTCFGNKGKLSPRFIGPFMIADRIGAVAYHLTLPDHLDHVHNVFHVSILQKFFRDEDRYQHIDVGEIKLQLDATYV
ncbi:uncharacterized protein LOC132305012 [Cornus florida]|uniref:uncharacterized protein LOC132305012 n=1 Tax=Cornus florida TaxID=4283 RepID=UPI00289E82C8|nr:uncharacterized protein LOC132305012 [Cornus florida]